MRIAFWGTKNANRRFEAICSKVMRIVRSEKLQNESFPKFSNIRPELCPEFCSEFSPEIFEDFSCFVSWETETRKIHQKSPPFFNAKFPGKHEKIFTKLFWRARLARIGFSSANRFARIDSCKSPRFALRIAGPSKPGDTFVCLL